MTDHTAPQGQRELVGVLRDALAEYDAAHRDLVAYLNGPYVQGMSRTRRERESAATEKFGNAAIPAVRTLLSRAPTQEEGEPEDDFENEDYVRGWQDAKADSVDPRSTKPCPGCTRGDVPVMLDDDGTLCSVSGESGRWGHGQGDAYWFCADYVGVPTPPSESLVTAIYDYLRTELPDVRMGRCLAVAEDLAAMMRGEPSAEELDFASTLESGPLPSCPACHNDGGYCTLCRTPGELSAEVEALVQRIRTEVNFRIEHGVESGGHLEYVQERLDEVLAGLRAKGGAT